MAPALTPLQAAISVFLVALRLASADARTREVFLDIAARRLAHEYGRELP